MPFFLNDAPVFFVGAVAAGKSDFCVRPEIQEPLRQLEPASVRKNQVTEDEIELPPLFPGNVQRLLRTGSRIDHISVLGEPSGGEVIRAGRALWWRSPL